MLKLRIDTVDLAGRWLHRAGAWSSGESTIAPFDHPSIESFLIELPEHRLVVVRENPSGERSGAAHDRDGADGAAEGRTAILSSLLSWPLSVVVIVLPKDRGDRVELHTGATVTVPLFLAQCGSTLHGGWDVADLYPHLPFALDPGRAAYVLSHFGLPYSRRTIFPGVLQLTERGVAIWRTAERRLEVTYPEPLPRPLPRRLAQGADIHAAFQSLLGTAIHRAANGSRVACELSGGLDSGVATLVAARALGAGRVRSFGLLLPGVQKPQQQARRCELARRAGVLDIAVDADGLGPFSRPDLAAIDPVIPWGEYYREAFFTLGRAMTAQECRIVIRGLGGDEISELSAAEDPEQADSSGLASSDQEPGVACFLTAGAKRAYAALLESLDEAPAGSAAPSFYQAAAASAPVYLRGGIWPVYPYGTPKVVAFCRALPVEWRRDRMLQRSLLQAAGLSPEVVRPRQPETFLPLRDLMFAGRAAEYVRDIFRRPLLAELGLVDPERLALTFEAAARDPDAPERAHLLEAATMETMLRTWRGQPMGP